MKTQKSILGKTTNSVMNYLMGNNQTEPVAGQGATVLMWTDRYAYEVMKVSADKKKAILQQYLPERTDNHGMSDTQDYKYEKLNGVDKYVVYKWNAWRWEESKIVFTPAGISLPYEERKLLFSEEGDLKLIPGLTMQVFSYPIVNILWGQRKEYYDYSH